MTPERIVEAIAAGEKESTRYSDLYAGDSRSTIGAFSTPFMRVAAAAYTARLSYKRLKPEDVTPQMIKPELHIYVRDRGSAWEPRSNSVQAVVITIREGQRDEKIASAVHPLSFEDIPESLRYGFYYPSGPWRMAVFPLDLLNEHREVHVVFRESIDMRDSDGALRDTCIDCASSLKFRDLLR